MSAIGEERYKHEALFSILKDSSNILMRDHLCDQGLLKVDTDETDWSARLVWDYLPTMNAALPLSDAVITPGSPRDGVSFWLRLPHAPLLSAIGAYLHWFLETAIALGTVRPDAIEIAPKVLEGVAERVARDWYMGF